MSRIKSWFTGFMFRRGWVSLKDFDDLLADKVNLIHEHDRLAALHRMLKERVGNIETREARIKQLEVGIKPIPSKTEDIRQHLLDTDNEKAGEIKYRMLKQRTRQLVDNATEIAAYLRRLSMMEGRGNEDAARLHSAAQALHDPQYTVHLIGPDETEGEG